jgi:hypothetical protein
MGIVERSSEEGGQRMANLAEKHEASASATVWRDADGFRISIEFRDPSWTGMEYSTHRVSGTDTNDVRKLIAHEASRRGLDAGAYSIWWKLKELIPVP